MISPQKFHHQAKDPLVKINLVQYNRSQKSDSLRPYSDQTTNWTTKESQFDSRQEQPSTATPRTEHKAAGS